MVGKVKKVCRKCGSDDVLADAYAYWSTIHQHWAFASVFCDKGTYCNNCDEECRIEEVPLMESPDETPSQGIRP